MRHDLNYIPDAADTSRLWSPGLWKHFDEQPVLPGRNADMFHFFDDFFNAGAALASNVSAWTGGTPPITYEAYGTTGVTFLANQPAAGDDWGVLRVTIDADNEEGIIMPNDEYVCPFGAISNTAGDTYRQAFEARVRFSDVADTTGMSKAIGMGTPGSNASAGLFADGAASLTINNFVGFRSLNADGNGMDAVHVDADTAAVVMEADSGLAAQLIAADTWVKFGFEFDGTNIWWWVNGQRIVFTTKVTPGTTSFPNADSLHPVFGCRAQGAIGTLTYDIDWWRYARWIDVRDYRSAA